MVEYIRKQMLHLEELSSDTMVMNGEIPWLPFEPPEDMIEGLIVREPYL